MTADYPARIVEHLWQYRRVRFADADHLFDDRREPSPPMFATGHAAGNVLLRPGAGDEETEAVLGAIPVSKRHRWFRSMKSSQALAQSVFGNLMELRKLDVLSPLTGDGGEPLFVRRHGPEAQAYLQHEVEHLEEKARGKTRLDLLIVQGPYRTAVECKLAESGFGRCSQPLPRPVEVKHGQDHNGDYVRQQARPVSCSLAALGAAYWAYIPKLFTGWPAESDYCPCPLNRAYQLTRNVLAACVRPDRSVDLTGGRVVLVYDDRNPAFEEKGEAGKVYDTVKKSLRNPALLQKTTWQQVAACLRQDAETAWLAKALADKYGIV